MSLQDDWCNLVDSVAAINSAEPLPAEFTAIDFLPGGRELPDALLQHVRAGAAQFDAESRVLFCPQMTVEESYHAAPVAPRSSSVFAFSSPAPSPASPQENNGNRASGSAGDDAEKRPTALGHDGPDFFEVYRTHAVAARRKAEAATGGGLLRPLGSASRLASGFMLPEYYSQKHRRLDFIPIIFVPASVSSTLQLLNIRDFLERGVYVDPATLFLDAETGAVNIQDSKPDVVIVSPGSFLDADKYTVAYKMFRVVDDPRQVKNWRHVCACIVDGNEWQFRGWYPNEPASVPVSELLQRVCGFLPYFEEDTLPRALQQWHVKPLVLTRRLVKSHTHILQASVFWEHLYTFLETHHFFKLFTVPNN